MEYEKIITELVNSREYKEALSLPLDTRQEYIFLAKGEYNVNLVFWHPIWEKKLVLRINIASQMKLKNQIEYEANALNLLKETGRTPKVYYVDNSKKYIEKGILVMDYLPGKSLDYNTDLQTAAEILADIHALRIPENHTLLQSDNSIAFILDECEDMLSVYLESEKALSEIKERLTALLCKARSLEKSIGDAFLSMYRCLINTELNSSNFLIHGDDSYLIDWEKPIYGYPAQDLGHFLAPTTTFWKTDIILTEKQIEDFIDRYIELVNDRFDTRGIKEATYIFIKINCIRGLTWCAMAYVQYLNQEKELINESTGKKLYAYLSNDFIEKIEKIYE